MTTDSHSTTRSLTLHYKHRLYFTQSVFALENPLLAEVMTAEKQDQLVEVVVVYDNGLLNYNPTLAADIAGYFQNFSTVAQLAISPLGIDGGEQVKNDWSMLEKIWQTIHEAGLCRHSLIIAVGGGALLDLVGFAASTAHRGIPIIRIPTTSLSQGDGGVGVKNAVNYFNKKNWLGSFTVPHAVINDSAFLRSLSEQEKRNGLVEAMKVALIRDLDLFEFIEGHAEALSQFDREPFEEVIRRSALVHLEHIAASGDPFELGTSRPLDFGHWAAHKLELLSGFALSHGEAVAVGMALDLMYAKDSGLLAEQTMTRIFGVCETLGFLLYSTWLEASNEIGRSALLAGLEEFREHLGGQLTIPMVTDVGMQTDVHEMCPETIAQAIVQLKTRGDN